ncbi:Uu.00g122180.m01.CDS01 [Anthostomella pinea]|uniref:Uu.00g122180.m01.CDS01 n=1 Tax=Anthostomella pinea TaxID=933095 RepID=A0AAI8VI62_9PEZI|nr:Uu.00g122180.m01.CDS01 [Anthostomella pinea]
MAVADSEPSSSNSSSTNPTSTHPSPISSPKQPPKLLKGGNCALHSSELSGTQVPHSKPSPKRSTTGPSPKPSPKQADFKSLPKRSSSEPAVSWLLPQPSSTKPSTKQLDVSDGLFDLAFDLCQEARLLALSTTLVADSKPSPKQADLKPLPKRSSPEPADSKSLFQPSPTKPSTKQLDVADSEPLVQPSSTKPSLTKRSPSPKSPSKQPETAAITTNSRRTVTEKAHTSTLPLHKLVVHALSVAVHMVFKTVQSLILLVKIWLTGVVLPIARAAKLNFEIVFCLPTLGKLWLGVGFDLVCIFHLSVYLLIAKIAVGLLTVVNKIIFVHLPPVDRIIVGRIVSRNVLKLNDIIVVQGIPVLLGVVSKIIVKFLEFKLLNNILSTWLMQLGNLPPQQEHSAIDSPSPEWTKAAYPSPRPRPSQMEPLDEMTLVALDALGHDVSRLRTPSPENQALKNPRCLSLMNSPKLKKGQKLKPTGRTARGQAIAQARARSKLTNDTNQTEEPL